MSTDELIVWLQQHALEEGDLIMNANTLRAGRSMDVEESFHHGRREAFMEVIIKLKTEPKV